MSIHVPQNFYRETITRAVSLVGATNIYVSAHPSPDEGYLTISPASATLREIIYYTAKGTDGNGTYVTVTLANRGLGGTTAQTHVIGEAVRMNVGAETIQEVSDAIDQIVAAAAQNASTTTKGIVKLSTAPASATTPIAVGDNDPRLSTRYNFGDGSDGVVAFDGVNTFSFASLVGSTYTLSRNVYGTTVTVSNSIIIIASGYILHGSTSITNAGTIHNNGGNGGAGAQNVGSTGGIAGTAGALAPGGIFPAGLVGKAGGAGATNGGAGAVAGVAGTNTTYTLVGNASAGSTGQTYDTAGAAGGAAGTATTSETIVGISLFTGTTVIASGVITSDQLIYRPVASSSFFTTSITPSSGGGGGGGARTSGSPGGGGGGGGSGASGGWVMVSSKLITNTGTISANGGNGGNGATSTVSAGTGGGGAGGNGGIVLLVYKTLTDSGTITASAGTLGTGGTGGAAGTAGKVYKILLT